MIFLDNASTTKMYKEVLDVYNEISNQHFFNASAMYKKGLESKNLIQDARKNILSKLGADKYNLIFTGSATESNNTAIMSFANRKGNFVFSMAEHPSVFQVAKELENKGNEVRFVGLNEDGTVNKEEFVNAIDENTVFVSIMHVCNETGAINPIRELVKLSKSKNSKIIFHSDGVQAFLKVPYMLDYLDVDLYIISSHKLNGPKGIGALIVKNNISINPLILGGGQENNKRSGTENVAGICAFSKAVDLNYISFKKDQQIVAELKNYFVHKLKTLPYFSSRVLGEDYSPYILQCSFIGVKAETLLHLLEEKEIYISNGSACSSKKQGNRILSAMGLNKNEIESSVRFSFNSSITKSESDMVFNELKIATEQYLNIQQRK